MITQSSSSTSSTVIVSPKVTMLAGSGNPVFALMSEMDVHHLPTGHWPMFSRPRDLAALLNEIART